MNTSIQTVRGATRLVFDSVEGITNSVERMHETIARHPLPLAPPPDQPTRAHGIIATAVYAVIRGVNAALREGADVSLGLVAGNVDAFQRSGTEIKITAALNGVLGDHLEATANPLATAMCLMTPQLPLALERSALSTDLPQASPHLVVLVHGLSLSELSWCPEEAPGLGDRLQEELGCTPLYLRYNTGRHISSNGQDLSTTLGQLFAAWPVPVESLSLVGHSMGGLVIRSACWYAEQARDSWLQNLRRVVCLGTPHHGSPVEKAGHALDLAMQMIQYTEPLAFGRRRSVGIKDLRHGNLLEEDWQDHAPDQSRPDTRKVIPLLNGVDYYCAAASLGRDALDPLGLLVGDLLVRPDSAMGSHQDELRTLNIKPENSRVFHNCSHLDLLVDERVHRQIIDWFRTR